MTLSVIKDDKNALPNIMSTKANIATLMSSAVDQVATLTHARHGDITARTSVQANDHTSTVHGTIS